MPGWAIAAKYLNCSITLRKRMKGSRQPYVQKYAGEARQSLEKAAMLSPTSRLSICSNMHRVLNLAHRSLGPVRRLGLKSGSR